MGCHANVTAKSLPKQGSFLGKWTDVFFHYDTKTRFRGVFVRDDAEEPFHSIIRLQDGRYILTTECQHTVPE